MLKESIISIIIVILIVFGDIKTQNYTVEAVEETTNYLLELRDVIINDDELVDIDVAKQKINEIHQKWDTKYELLAYYIEHDELEKVETEITGLKAYLDKEELSEAVAEIDKSIYILEHIKEKNAFKLKNIF